MGKRVIWVCHRCWPANHESLTPGRLPGAIPCEICGKVYTGFEDMSAIWSTWYVNRCLTHFRSILDALKVMAWTKETRAWLKQHDPKALEQADKAIKATGDEPAGGWEDL